MILTKGCCYEKMEYFRCRLVARSLAQLHFVGMTDMELINRDGHKVTYPEGFLMFDRLTATLDAFAWDRSVFSDSSSY